MPVKAPRPSRKREFLAVDDPFQGGAVEALGDDLLQGVPVHLLEARQVPGFGVGDRDREDGLLDAVGIGRNILADPRLLQGEAQRRRLVIDQGFGQDIQGDVEFLVGVQAVDAAAGDIGLAGHGGAFGHAVVAAHHPGLRQRLLQRDAAVHLDPVDSRRGISR